MRQQGRLTEWNDVRGFGFVTPLTEGPRVFVHISEFPRGERRPLVDDLVKVLADDNDGDRHQRFILRLASGQTLLLAHNIDIAPRLRGLKAGDSVGFSGVYEWNPQGGVVHWTHHDPKGRHLSGWLMYNGSMYQ